MKMKKDLSGHGHCFVSFGHHLWGNTLGLIADTGSMLNSVADGMRVAVALLGVGVGQTDSIVLWTGSFVPCLALRLYGFLVMVPQKGVGPY